MNESRAGSDSVETSVPGVGPRPWTILVADDDPSFRKVVRDLLEEALFEVVGEAVDGAEAVRLAEDLQPDCVILDMKMPVMDGESALAGIKASCPHTDVIALSTLEWETRIGPAPDAALTKDSMEMLPVLIETLAADRQEQP